MSIVGLPHFEILRKAIYFSSVLTLGVLIVAGSLVGASGLILTSIMCKAMNRSLAHVLFGVLQPSEDTASADEVYAGKVKSTSADEVAMLFDTAQRAVIVPGYGMAVAQAQHAVRDLASLLQSRGIEVEFAIHPVAGRMPGHMNVLLAEAEVPYEQLKEMDAVNPTMAQTDVVLVIGANDVVNPEARTNPNSPITGMPFSTKGRKVSIIRRASFRASSMRPTDRKVRPQHSGRPPSMGSGTWTRKPAASSTARAAWAFSDSK